MFRGSKWIGGGVGLLVVAILYFAVARPVQVLPRIEPAPVFQLVDHRGDLFDPTERRAITLYAFGAVRDEAGLEAYRNLLEAVALQLSEEPQLVGRVQAVFITVHPEHDTPDVLAATAAAFPAFETLPVTFLTGSPVAIRLAVGNGFGVYYKPVGGADPRPGVASAAPRAAEDAGSRAGGATPEYEPTVVVVDEEGIIRSRYPLTEARADLLLRDARLIAREAEARGISKAVYGAAHLFLCYPR